jgi:hypothetical protein
MKKYNAIRLQDPEYKAKRRAQMKRRKAALRAAGLCVECGRERSPLSTQRCTSCLVMDTERTVRYRLRKGINV